MGTSHHKNGSPCQDAHAYKMLENSVLLIAVADGAGSAARSDEGAQCAVRTTISTLENALAQHTPENKDEWQELLTQAFSDAQQAIFALAEAEGAPPRVFASTLTLVIANHAWLVTGQIGDGIVVAQTDEGDLFAASTPQHGEYANETNFITMEGALEIVEGRVYPQGVRALAAMTDGLLRLVIDVTTGQPHAPFFTPLLAFPAKVTEQAQAAAQLCAFLDSPRVNARTDDDKTIVLAARAATPPPEADPAAPAAHPPTPPPPHADP